MINPPPFPITHNPSIAAVIATRIHSQKADVDTECCDDGEWDIPLVPHIIGLRNATAKPDTEHGDTVSNAATRGDLPDMDSFSDLIENYAQAPGASPHDPVDPSDPPAAPAAPPIKDSPTEAQIAAHWVVAEPLGEWAARYIWAFCSGALVGHQQIFAVNDTPKDLARRIQVILQRALLSPTAVLTAIYYARRLPGAFASQPSPGSLEATFKEDLYRGGLEMGVFKLFCVGAMLANKTLDDNTYTNKAWRDMAEISLYEINSFEVQALSLFSYRLYIKPTDWSEFAAGMLGYHETLRPSSSPPLPPIGAAFIPTPHGIVLNAFREITKAIATPTIGLLSKQEVPNPFFFGQEEASAAKAAYYQGQRAIEAEIEDFDLDAGGPLKDEYVPTRRRKSSAAEDISKEDEAKSYLPKPTKWSPADDPVVEREPKGTQRHSLVDQHVVPGAPLLSAHTRLPLKQINNGGHVGWHHPQHHRPEPSYAGPGAPKFSAHAHQYALKSQAAALESYGMQRPGLPQIPPARPSAAANLGFAPPHPISFPAPDPTRDNTQPPHYYPLFPIGNQRRVPPAVQLGQPRRPSATAAGSSHRLPPAHHYPFSAYDPYGQGTFYDAPVHSNRSILLGPALIRA